MHDTRAEVWHCLGDALLRINDRVGALHAFRQALRLDDRRPQTYRALGLLLLDCGQVERALHCFECAHCGDSP
jgi:cytochrome c-type biogenesis protein CcmH/NrfG